ncbi:Uncharacterised protein [Klebsiella michiganensis]|uniref:Uncharacterized protein n=1 Tax=Klebsiella michiganensis TaxID=1134687 RepID=A0A7H4PLE6_9ENTR|nr:Uncharacterised protein [Klebsiella michiganensis]
MKTHLRVDIFQTCSTNAFHQSGMRFGFSINPTKPKMLRLFDANRHPIERLSNGIVQCVRLSFSGFRAVKKGQRRKDVLRQSVPQQYSAYSFSGH